MAIVCVDVADEVDVSDGPSMIVTLDLDDTVNAADLLTVGLGFDYGDEVDASDSNDPQWFTPVADVVQVSSAVVFNVVTAELLEDEVDVSDSQVFVLRSVDLADTVDVSDAFVHARVVDVVDVVDMATVFLQTANATVNWADVVDVSDVAVLGKGEDMADIVDVSDVIQALRTTYEDTADVVDVSEAYTLASIWAALDWVDTVDIVDAQSFGLSAKVDLADEVDASDGVLWNDPAALAWVVNTESTAASWFTNFGFHSLAQLGSNVLLAREDGLFVLDPNTDDGAAINARLETGLGDWDAPQRKRVSDIWVDYNSSVVDAPVLEVTVEAAESGTATMQVEPRPATAARTSRVTVPKGLTAVNWRFTWRNVGGADFEVNNAEHNVAVSTRRI